MIEMPDFLAGKRRRREAGFIALPFFHFGQRRSASASAFIFQPSGVR
ncbi:hypothetical protein ECP02999174_5223, partial [Escherichia coli P0299917.4]